MAEKIEDAQLSCARAGSGKTIVKNFGCGLRTGNFGVRIADWEFRIADCGLRILCDEGCSVSVVEKVKSEAKCDDTNFEIRNPHLAIRSAIRNSQSASRNPQSAIRNPKSEIRNPQSPSLGINLESALRRNVAVALLSHLGSSNLNQKRFGELTNFRVRSHGRGQWTTPASDEKPFPFLL